MAAGVALTVVALTSPWWMTLCVMAGASALIVQGMGNEDE